MTAKQVQQAAIRECYKRGIPLFSPEHMRIFKRMWVDAFGEPDKVSLSNLNASIVDAEKRHSAQRTLTF